MTKVLRDIVMATKSLSIGYGKEKNAHHVLEDLTLNLHRGQLVSFMGPNGIGKTTLLRTISGLMPPISGEILLLGKEISSYELTELARKISLVLTDPVQAGNLSVKDLVSMGRYPYTNWFLNFNKEDLKKINEAIELVQLEELAERKIFELSDGQMQKALVARALAQDGQIMILDEPNSHLDLNNRIEIMRILRNLCKKTGKTILVATHELDLALQTSDWLWLATRNGKIIEGVPEDLVLNDSFDHVFDTKGFDLKTGRVVHEDSSVGTISLSGEGFMYLWTKNALERNGLTLSDIDPALRIMIDTGRQRWTIIHGEQKYELDSIESLIAMVLDHFAS